MKHLACVPDHVETEEVETKSLFMPALDWAVSQAVGVEFTNLFLPSVIKRQAEALILAHNILVHQISPSYDTTWWLAHVGPVEWLSQHRARCLGPSASGPTREIAAMRCLVTAIRGEKVRIPRQMLLGYSRNAIAVAA